MSSWARHLISLSPIFIILGLDQLISLFSCICVISFLLPASQVSPFLWCKWFSLSSTGWPSFGVWASTDLTQFSSDYPHYTSLPILSVLLRGRTGNWMFVLGHSPASLSDSLPSSEIRESWLCESVLPLVMDFLVLEVVGSKSDNRCQQVEPLILYVNHFCNLSISKGWVILLPTWCALPTSGAH